MEIIQEPINQHLIFIGPIWVFIN